MRLQEARTAEEAIQYLKGDSREAIVNDIGPLLQSGKAEGGYFGVPLHVLCMADFLGSLYTGKKPSSDNAVQFLKDVVGQADEAYRCSGHLLYEMYRHGTVHRFAPQELQERRTEQKLSWCPYKGPRSATVRLGGQDVSVRHLHVLLCDPPGYLLPISINCLYHDLLEAVSIFQRVLASDTSALSRWNKAVKILSKPKVGDWGFAEGQRG